MKGDSKKRKIEKCVLRFGLLQWMNKILKTKDFVHFKAAPEANPNINLLWYQLTWDTGFRSFIIANHVTFRVAMWLFLQPTHATILCVHYITSSFRRFSTHVWQNARIDAVRCAMGHDVYFCFQNFVKGILCICIVFSKTLRPLLLYLTYELAQIF